MRRRLRFTASWRKQNPETYLSYVAATLHNLGILHDKQNRTEEARRAHEEALKIRRQLAQQNPETYLPDVADTLNDLGMLDFRQNRIKEARQATEEALDIYERFAEQNPERYAGDAARAKSILEHLKQKTTSDIP